MFADTLPKKPDRLLERGYNRQDESSSDCTRWVRFVKRIETSFEDLVIDLTIEYTLTISDDPDASWSENCSYDFEEVKLRTYMKDDSDFPKIRYNYSGEKRLDLRSFKTLERLAEALGWRPR